MQRRGHHLNNGVEMSCAVTLAAGLAVAERLRKSDCSKEICSLGYKTLLEFNFLLTKAVYQREIGTASHGHLDLGRTKH